VGDGNGEGGSLRGNGVGSLLVSLSIVGTGDNNNDDDDDDNNNDDDDGLSLL